MVMDDEQLLTETGSGNRTAFKAIFQKYGSPLLGYIHRLARTRNDQEEILQEAMVRIWTKAGLFDSRKGRAKPWIYRIATRVTLNWLASKGVKSQNQEVMGEETLENIPASRDPQPDEMVIRLDDAKEANAALEKLPEDLRLAVTLRHLEGLSIEEIAQTMECPEGTVKSRIFHGLKKLREILGKEERHEQHMGL